MTENVRLVPSEVLIFSERRLVKDTFDLDKLFVPVPAGMSKTNVFCIPNRVGFR